MEKPRRMENLPGCLPRGKYVLILDNRCWVSDRGVQGWLQTALGTCNARLRFCAPKHKSQPLPAAGRPFTSALQFTIGGYLTIWLTFSVLFEFAV